MIYACKAIKPTNSFEFKKIKKCFDILIKYFRIGHNEKNGLGLDYGKIKNKSYEYSRN